MSVQTFCLRNNVPYNIFHKWYKDTRKKIVEVQVDGVPSGPPSESVPSSPSGDACLDDVKWQKRFTPAIFLEETDCL